MPQPGYDEITVTTQERIGLPKWSSMKLFAAAHATVPSEQFDAGYDYLFRVVDLFMRERVETVTRSLNLWSGIETTVDHGDKQGLAPQGIQLTETTVTFSMQETVGLPDKCSVDIFGSVKSTASLGCELLQFEQIAFKLATQMAGKRDLVLKNPRPWTSQNG